MCVYNCTLRLHTPHASRLACRALPERVSRLLRTPSRKRKEPEISCVGTNAYPGKRALRAGPEDADLAACYWPLPTCDSKAPPRHQPPPRGLRQHAPF